MKPITFVAFVTTVIGILLTRAQRVLASVFFDGAEPGSFEGEDRDVARRLFGDVETVPAMCREVLVAICGARGGKSYLLVALHSLWRALTADLSPLAPGEVAVALICAPDLRLARQALRFALGAAESVPAIAALVVSRTSDFFEIRRPDGHHVRIECLPANARGAAVRGRSLVSLAEMRAASFVTRTTRSTTRQSSTLLRHA